MHTYSRFFSFLTLFYLLTLSGFANAEQIIQNDSIAPAPQTKTYTQQVGDKALHGVTNIATGFLEIPKNMINTTNAEGSNIFFGVAGGGVKGLINAMGRIGSGFADVLTMLIPTKPIAQPQYIWEDFDANTTYDNAFRLEDNKQ